MFIFCMFFCKKIDLSEKTLLLNSTWDILTTSGYRRLALVIR